MFEFRYGVFFVPLSLDGSFIGYSSLLDNMVQNIIIIYLFIFV